MSNTQIVDEFVTGVKSITDTDYGDFMRKSNLYFNRMLENFPNADDKKRRLLLKIKTEIQYSPTRDIDTTLLNIVRDAKKLRDLV